MEKVWAWSQISNLSSVTNSLGNFDKLNLNSLSLGLIICKMGLLVSNREAVEVEKDVKWVLSRAEVLGSCPVPSLYPMVHQHSKAILQELSKIW